MYLCSLARMKPSTANDSTRWPRPAAHRARHAPTTRWARAASRCCAASRATAIDFVRERSEQLILCRHHQNQAARLGTAVDRSAAAAAATVATCIERIGCDCRWRWCWRWRFCRRCRCCAAAALAEDNDLATVTASVGGIVTIAVACSAERQRRLRSRCTRQARRQIRSLRRRQWRQAEIRGESSARLAVTATDTDCICTTGRCATQQAGGCSAGGCSAQDCSIITVNLSRDVPLYYCLLISKNSKIYL